MASRDDSYVEAFGEIGDRPSRRHLTDAPEPSQEDIEQEARDLAANDCQMWDNLPPSAKEFYLAEAREEYA